MKTKKVWVVGIIASLFLMPAFLNGEITKGRVNGVTIIESLNSNYKEIAPFTRVRLVKITEKPVILDLRRSADEGWFFAKVPVEMKIGKDVYELPIATLYLDIGCTWSASEKISKKILQADSITLLVHYKNKPTTAWKVPSGVLIEWQKILSETNPAVSVPPISSSSNRNSENPLLCSMPTEREFKVNKEWWKLARNLPPGAEYEEKADKMIAGKFGISKGDVKTITTKFGWYGQYTREELGRYPENMTWGEMEMIIKKVGLPK